LKYNKNQDLITGDAMSSTHVIPLDEDLWATLKRTN